METVNDDNFVPTAGSKALVSVDTRAVNVKVRRARKFSVPGVDFTTDHKISMKLLRITSSLHIMLTLMEKWTIVVCPIKQRAICVEGGEARGL